MKLRLIGHARFIVEHHKKDRTHRHVIWLRIDVNRMRAVEMTDDYEKHQATARQLELELGLKRGQSVLGKDRTKTRPSRRPQSWETFRGNKTGVNPHELAQKITALYEVSKNASEFAEALKCAGCQLVQGDRTICLVDSAGHVHSLARRLPGIPAAYLKRFLADLTQDMLPLLAHVAAPLPG